MVSGVEISDGGRMLWHGGNLLVVVEVRWLSSMAKMTGVFS